MRFISSESILTVLHPIKQVLKLIMVVYVALQYGLLQCYSNKTRIDLLFYPGVGIGGELTELHAEAFQKGLLDNLSVRL